MEVKKIIESTLLNNDFYLLIYDIIFLNTNGCNPTNGAPVPVGKPRKTFAPTSSKHSILVDVTSF